MQEIQRDSKSFKERQIESNRITEIQKESKASKRIKMNQKDLKVLKQRTRVFSKRTKSF